MGPIVSIHQPEFMPWPGFIHKLATCDVFVVLDTVQFRKNYFQNRNRIRDARGDRWLTVPVKKAPLRTPIDEIEIAEDPNWCERAVKSLEQCYAQAPHVDSLGPIIEILRRETRSLRDLNVALIRHFADVLDIDTDIVLASDLKLERVVGGSDVVLAISEHMGASTYVSGRFGRDYLEMQRFHELGIRVVFQDYSPPQYRQLHEPFVPGLSVLDILLTQGPETLDLIMGGAREFAS